jgi:tetratricopeptide repeat protein 8
MHMSHFPPPIQHAQAAWLLKTRALTEQSAVDEIELEEEGLADVLMDDNATAKLPRMCCGCLSLTIHT